MKGKTVYLFPNLFTSANLLVGFYSIILSARGDFYGAAIAIVLAVVFDNLDGKIARLVGATSRFGFEYDSLSDLVSFGVAPAILFYSLFYSAKGNLGIVVSMVYLLSGALRLAKFNITKHSDRFFGLPIPGAALVVASSVLLFYQFSLVSYKELFMLPVLAASYLMISNIRYEGFKDITMSRKLSLFLFTTTTIAIILVALRPKIVIPAISFVYLISGPMELAVKLFKHRRKIVGSNRTKEEKDV